MIDGAKKKRVVIWGTFDTGKPRTRLLLRACEKLFGDPQVIHFNLWEGVEDKTSLHGKLRKLGVALKALFSYPSLILRYLLSPSHDVVLIPYFGVLDVLVLYSFAKIKRAEICLDIFISIYDTVVIDRKLITERSFIAKLIFVVESFVYRLADKLVIDTQTHADYITHLFKLPAGKVRVVPVGAETDRFYPKQIFPYDKPGRRVLFYGQYIPLHGIDVIVNSAEILETLGNEDIKFTLIGRGQLKSEIDALIEQKNLKNIERIEWVDYEDLNDWIVRSDICLGVFAPRGKSLRVIPNKVYQCMAAGKPVITADSPALREYFDGIKFLVLVRPGSPDELAVAILRLMKDLSRKDRPTIQMPSIGIDEVAVELEKVIGHSTGV